MFNLKKFLLDGFKVSLEEGSLGEGQVRMAAINYMISGILTESDMQEVERLILDVRRSKEREQGDESEDEHNSEHEEGNAHEFEE